MKYYEELNAKSLLIPSAQPNASSPWKSCVKLDCFDGLPDVGQEKGVVQRYWTKLIPILNEELRKKSRLLKFHDTHNSAAIGIFYKPDIVMTTTGGGLNVINIVAVGELKGSDRSTAVTFPNEEKAQLFNYLQELLKLQPYRLAVY